MHILILSCNTGGGHNSCARAMSEAFTAKGHQCRTEDAVRFVSGGLSRFMTWGHVVMYRRFPGLFRWGYGFAEKHPSLLRDDSPVYRLLTGGLEALYQHLQLEHYDAVICTHVFAGLLLHQTLKEHPMPLTTAFVATDYTCSPGTAKCGADLYFIPDAALAAEFQAQGVPPERIIASGMPVRQDFCAPRKERPAGLPPRLLVMCGSMGCGPLRRLTKLLVKNTGESAQLTVVCGSNRKLRKQLTKKYGELPNVRICGFVSDVASLMDEADLYLTKPGGLSTSEATAKGLPMVLIDAVSGCEGYNLQFFLDRGCAVTADKPAQLSELCAALLKDQARLEQMAAAFPRAQKSAAQIICDALCEIQKRS